MTQSEAKRMELVTLPVQPDPLLTLIERVACDPSADVGKMRALLEMHQSLQDRQAVKAFGVAMAKAQQAMEPIRAEASNTQTRSKYASYPALDRVLRPIYTRHGFALSFNTSPCEQPDKLNLVCDVFHTDGHIRRYDLPMPIDGKGAKGNDVMTKTHATGSGLSYGQRYLTKMIWNISVAKDDDGNAAGGRYEPATFAEPTGELLSPAQLAQLKAIAIEVGANLPAFCKWANVESLDDILASKFEQAKAALESKRRKASA